MVTPPNPLPDSLTRLLDTSAARSFAPTPGDAKRAEIAGAAPALAPEGRLDVLVIRSLAVAASGLIWFGILWLILRHLMQ